MDLLWNGWQSDERNQRNHIKHCNAKPKQMWMTCTFDTSENSSIMNQDEWQISTDIQSENSTLTKISVGIQLEHKRVHISMQLGMYCFNINL